MKEYLITQENDKSVHIPMVSMRGGDVSSIVAKYMKRSLEGICDNFGYIEPESVQLVSKNLGKILTVDGQSMVEYKVKYKFKSLYPSPGDVYVCVIESITKMGLICYLKGADSLDASPLIVIVPQVFLGENSLSSFSEGDTCKVEVMESRIKYKNRQIQSVAKIV